MLSSSLNRFSGWSESWTTESAVSHVDVLELIRHSAKDYGCDADLRALVHRRGDCAVRRFARTGIIEECLAPLDTHRPRAGQRGSFSAVKEFIPTIGRTDA